MEGRGDASEGREIPNPKQTDNGKKGKRGALWDWFFGRLVVCLGFEIWDLGFGLRGFAEGLAEGDGFFLDLVCVQAAVEEEGFG